MIAVFILELSFQCQCNDNSLIQGFININMISMNIGAYDYAYPILCMNELFSSCVVDLLTKYPSYQLGYAICEMKDKDSEHAVIPPGIITR